MKKTVMLNRHWGLYLRDFADTIVGYDIEGEVDGTLVLRPVRLARTNETVPTAAKVPGPGVSFVAPTPQDLAALPTPRTRKKPEAAPKARPEYGDDPPPGWPDPPKPPDSCLEDRELCDTYYVAPERRKYPEAPEYSANAMVLKDSIEIEDPDEKAAWRGAFFDRKAYEETERMVLRHKRGERSQT